jgi:hypothetical protein
MESIEEQFMASTKKGGDRLRRSQAPKRPERAGPDPESRAVDDRGTQPYQKENRSPLGPQSSPDEDADLPADGGTETDRGTVVKQDRNFDDGPVPNSRK